MTQQPLLEDNNAAEGTPLSNESSLSNYVGPYVTDMLGRGQALSETPYEAYTGPLTAGASDLQETAFGGIGDLNIPTDKVLMPQQHRVL